jgi:acylphosphatase
VSNRDDGCVEAVFEGSPDDVAALVSWCRTGPPGALVTAIDVVEEAVEGLRGFRIRR